MLPFIIALNLYYHIFVFYSIFYNFVATSSIVHGICYFYIMVLFISANMLLFITMLLKSVVNLFVLYDSTHQCFYLAYLTAYLWNFACPFVIVSQFIEVVVSFVPCSGFITASWDPSSSFFLAGPSPVSYTHLDVYKRQLLSLHTYYLLRKSPTYI